MFSSEFSGNKETDLFFSCSFLQSLYSHKAQGQCLGIIQHLLIWCFGANTTEVESPASPELLTREGIKNAKFVQLSWEVGIRGKPSLTSTENRMQCVFLLGNLHCKVFPGTSLPNKSWFIPIIWLIKFILQLDVQWKLCRALRTELWQHVGMMNQEELWVSTQTQGALCYSSACQRSFQTYQTPQEIAKFRGCQRAKDRREQLSHQQVKAIGFYKSNVLRLGETGKRSRGLIKEGIKGSMKKSEKRKKKIFSVWQGIIRITSFLFGNNAHTAVMSEGREGRHRHRNMST